MHFPHHGVASPMLIAYKSPITSAEFAEYFLFRWKMLRKPLNLPGGSERDELEENSFHMAAYHSDAVIGVSRLHIESDGIARIRYMAVHDDYQNQGVGSQLLQELENFAHTKKLRVCWLYARKKATRFYIKNGYVIKGKGNSELSELKHERMEKQLA